MTWGAIAGGAIGLVGGAMQSGASSRAAREQSKAGIKAAEMQLQASREAQALQAAGIKGGLQMQAPSIYGGNLALSALMSGMGLGPARGVYGQQGPSGNAGGVAPGTMATGVGSYMNAAGQAVDAEGNPVTSMDPYGLMGTNYGATDAEMAAAAAPYAGAFTEQFTGQDIYKDPSYQFRLEEGERLLRARQAAGGNRWGGQAMKDVANYGQQAASQEYGAAYDRFNKNKALLYDRLSGIAGLGGGAGNAGAASLATGAGNMGSMGMTGAQGAGNYMTSAAASRAGGMMGSTNALVGGANAGLGNWFTMSRLNGQNNYNPGGGPMVNGGGYSNFPSYLLPPGP